MNPDRDHLKLLSIFHFVFGVFSALFAIFPVVFLLIGFGMISGIFPGESQPHDNAPLLTVGWFFIIIAIMMMLYFLTLAVLKIHAGICLANEKRHTFCMVVACLDCIQFPFGTALGVMTMIVLLRPSVKQLFGVDSPGTPVILEESGGSSS